MMRTKMSSTSMQKWSFRLCCLLLQMHVCTKQAYLRTHAHMALQALHLPCMPDDRLAPCSCSAVHASPDSGWDHQQQASTAASVWPRGPCGPYQMHSCLLHPRIRRHSLCCGTPQWYCDHTHQGKRSLSISVIGNSKGYM